MQAQQNIDTDSISESEVYKPFKALVVDDKELDRLILKSILDKKGFQVAFANDKKTALEEYKRDKPDIIFMDYYLEHNTGVDVSVLIRDIPEEQYVPIIFVSEANNEDVLVKCLYGGGDDFISKPVNETLLQAKVESLLRVKSIYDEVLKEKKLINKLNDIHKKDLTDADKVIYNIHSPLFDKPSHFNYTFLPQNILSGDLICSAINPSGQYMVIAGDNTGHGTPAAIGTLIVSEIFYSMVRKGFDIIHIVDEINKKLCRLLPIDRFFASTIIEIDENFEFAKVWNAGMPETIICDAYGSIKNKIKSMSPALGIMPFKAAEIIPQNIKLYHGDYIYAFSDGITEACNKHGDFFGQTGIEDLIESAPIDNNRYKYIENEFNKYTEGVAQLDDILLIEIKCIKGKGTNKNISRANDHVSALNWHSEICFESEAIRNNNPIPLLIHLLSEVQGLGKHRQKIFLILTEMYSNALEHGILDLDSSLKQVDDGFAHYYKLRQERLDSLEDALLTVKVDSKQEEENGVITICFEHNGKEYQGEAIDDAYKQSLKTNNKTSGRGMALLYELCRTVEFNKNGKQVIVEYEMIN